jgi:uncharacterized membrane protein YphA (DoxX/SURF4 family)
MKSKISLVARILLGFLLFVFGINKFIPFMPPLELSGSAQDFMMALMNTGYLLQIVGIVEITVGTLLLSNRFVALALLLFAPITVNIISFHLFLDPANIGAAALVTILNVYLLFINKEKYAAVLSARNTADYEGSSQRSEKSHPLGSKA